MNKTQRRRAYEDASGNIVRRGKVYDSGGRYVTDYSDAMAREYLEYSSDTTPEEGA